MQRSFVSTASEATWCQWNFTFFAVCGYLLPFSRMFVELLCFGNDLETTLEQGKQLKYFSSLSAILIPTCEEASTEMKLSALYFDKAF